MKSSSKQNKHTIQKKKIRPTGDSFNGLLLWGLLSGILLLTLIVYWSTFSNGFGV